MSMIVDDDLKHKIITGFSQPLINNWYYTACLTTIAQTDSCWQSSLLRLIS